jgi:hypothetical protein
VREAAVAEALRVFGGRQRLLGLARGRQVGDFAARRPHGPRSLPIILGL